jgi:4-hydroxybutyrate CoA-transferase
MSGDSVLPRFLTERMFDNDEALKRTVISGRRIQCGFATSEPYTFYATVWDFIRKEKIRDVELRGGLVLTPHPIFVGTALKRKGLLPGLADGLSLSLFAEWARSVNQATRKMESLAVLVNHYKRLQKRNVGFMSGFMSPVLNGIVPDSPLTRMLYPEYVQRNTARMGITDFQFSHFSDAAEVMAYTADGRPKTDLMVLVMTLPDANGELSHGPCAAFNGEVLERVIANTDQDVLLYLNASYPFTRGLADAPNSLHVDRLKPLADAGRLFVVLDDGPVPALPAGSFDKPLETELKIAEQVVDHIEANPGLTRGRAIQVGFGGTGVLAIRKLRESSWTGRAYTEMLEPFMLDLFESGKIAGSHIVERDGRRTLLDGKIVCTFALGTRGTDFYRRIDRNDAIVLAPSSRVVIPEAFHGGMGINNCLAIDFNGHVNTSARDKNHYSGVGGGAAILRGLSRGGISYLCMKSTHTTPEGLLRSSVFPFMPRGTPVCYTGPDVMGGREGALSYLVTEHGVAQMSGRTQSEFIRAIVSVAHPDFRPFLKRAAWREFRVAV